MKSFIDQLSDREQALVNKMRELVLRHDKAVDEKPGKIMQAKDAVCYNEDGVFKYGLARTSKGVTFHSMVMYANPDVAAFAKVNLKDVKFQKGCFNISDLANFDLDAFDEMMRISASTDFSPVIAHYKKKQKQ